MFVLDEEHLDLELTVALYREKRALRRRRLTSLLHEIEEPMAISPTLQGLGKKMALFKHNAELDAAKLSDEIDAATSETSATFEAAHGAIAGHRRDLEDVKAVVAEVAAATNGGPPLDPPAPAPTPEPVAVAPAPHAVVQQHPLSTGAPGQTQVQ